MLAQYETNNLALNFGSLQRFPNPSWIKASEYSQELTVHKSFVPCVLQSNIPESIASFCDGFECTVVGREAVSVKDGVLPCKPKRATINVPHS